MTSATSDRAGPSVERLTSQSLPHQEKLDPEVLCKENPILPEAAEHPEESEVVPAEACRAAVGSGRCVDRIAIFLKVEFVCVRCAVNCPVIDESNKFHCHGDKNGRSFIT